MILENKVIIVTGGSGLIGEAIIRDIKIKGGVPINFDQKDIGIDEVKYVNVDITDHENIRNAFQTLNALMGRIDGLVNSAYPRTHDWGISFENDLNLCSWRKNLDMQLNGYVACCQEAVKLMKARKAGSIVNIASTYGVVGNDMTIYEDTKIGTVAPYAAIKGGLINFTRYLASYCGGLGIRVNCVSPGEIFDDQDPVFVEKYEYKVPLKRMGRPDDISPAVSFLLSDESSYITGHNLMVDGGWTCI